jgi:hypothetical protein
MNALSKAQKERFEEAKKNGFLVCRKSGNEELRYAWVEYCRASNQPCIYADLKGCVADIVVKMTTSNKPRQRGCYEAIGETCKRFALCTHYIVENRDRNAWFVKKLSLERLHDACTAILATLRRYSV